MDGEIASKEIERKRGELDEISQYIWRNPEAGFKEVKASEKVADYLEREGLSGREGSRRCADSNQGFLWKWASGDWIYGRI